MNIFKKNTILRIAFVHLVSKHRQTIVAMLGVMFGITVFIFQAGIITGLQNYMIDKIINNSPHLHIFNDPEKYPPSIVEKMSPDPNHWTVLRNQKQKDVDKRIHNSNGIIEIIERNPEIQGAAPFVGTQAIFKAGFKELPATIAGVDIDKENRLFNVHRDQIAGDVMRLKTINNGIILGKGVAEKLGAKVDDIITVSTTFAVVDMKVVGITQTGITAIDDVRAMMNLRSAQKLMNADSYYVTDINIKLKNPDHADILSTEYEKMFGYRAQTWKDANAGIFGVFKIQNLATYMVIVSILIVAGFGIFNILMMMIYEKMTDIAILKSIGFKNRDIRNLFMIEALVIGFAGGVLGLIFGYVVCRIAAMVEVKIKGLVTLDHLNINFDPMFYVAGFAFAIISTALAGYIPARKASRIDPVDIIRGK
ncbi:lipoprotein-releasing system permease protein [Flexibacter flexilis DSM 6793]|uniref:Lipoprotein-releasing system permease protein n=1 Tax=Flexibacter flexilis DSM 6793 TaxID=927664 RepID=A0A1I1J4P6_9BACT|nr:ABC transporter permease [Flexibacter flexilis]SFC41588.1 lipoprotein-releasing system permease protein [Flexibacter flexilis DSM 6793]